MLIIWLLAVSVLSAQNVWTVQTVPNTRIESNDIHVSDPDDYLSDSAEININTALCAIRDQADVFVVTLSSIGDNEPKRFATQLFNHWGIGDAKTNNGVLLLFVEDQRALEFETGYGAETTLTDAKCERIFRNTIVPYFRAGDYEGGLCAGVSDIVTVFGGEIPMGLVAVPSANNKEENGADDFSIIFALFALFIMAMPILGVVYWLYKRKSKSDAVSDTCTTYEESGVIYVDGLKTTWSGSPWEGKGCLGGLTIGFSVFAIMFFVIAFMTARFPDLEEKRLYNWISIATLVLYLTWICFRQNHRALKTASQRAKQSICPKEVYKTAFNNTGTKIATWMAPWLGWVYYLVFKKRIEHNDDYRCPVCNAQLRKNNSFALPEIHAVENRVEALHFMPYRCANGHEIVIKERGKQFSKFKTCAKGGAYTKKLTNTETLRKANYSQSGEKRETYVCQHCGDVVTKMVVIPKLVHYTSSSSSSSSSYSSSSSSSRSSGGSFGGGRSGGGGYSGRW